MQLFPTFYALSEAMITRNLFYLSHIFKPCPVRNCYPLVRKMSYLNSDGLIPPDLPRKPRFGKVKVMLMVCLKKEYRIYNIMLTYLGYLWSHFGINDCKKHCLFTWRFWRLLSWWWRRLNSFKFPLLTICQLTLMYSIRNNCSLKY